MCSHFLLLIECLGRQRGLCFLPISESALPKKHGCEHDLQFRSHQKTASCLVRSDRYYGEKIHKYKEELASLGVATDIEKGARFVLSHIYLPVDVNQITCASVFSLLNNIRHFLLDNNVSCLPELLLNKVSKAAWLKTKFGYRAPAEYILFGSNWGAFFLFFDGPFIDKGHYGLSIALYGKELQEIGVTIDIVVGASILARHLINLSDFDSIKRVYAYLEQQYNWEPQDEASAMIWIRNGAGGSEYGAWARPAKCVPYNKDNLFSSRLIVLKKHYEVKLLSFFGRAFGVRLCPLMDDYCQLWKDWENSWNRRSHTDCCLFWSHVVNHWKVKTKKILLEGLSRLPASSSADGIRLIDKRDIFIPDDLLLKDLFSNSSDSLLFVWTPQPNNLDISQSKLLGIYRSIGVQTISSSVVKAESLPLPASLNVEETKLTDVYIRKGLLMLVLGFLANSVFGHEFQEQIRCHK